MPAALRQNSDPGDQPAPHEPSLEQPAACAPRTSFDGFLQQAARTRGDLHRRRWLFGVSIGVHGALLLLALLLATTRPSPAAPPPPRVPVTMLRFSPGPPPPKAAAAPAPSKPKPVRPAVAPRPAPVVQPAEPAREVAAEPEPAEEGASEQGETGGVKGGVPGTVASPGTVAPPGPSLSPAQARAMLERYLQEILRSRITARLVYPPEAERMGVEGTVAVRVRVDGTGKVVSVLVAGACPHEILCEAALQTVRAASPLPPPPRELGSLIDGLVPVTFRLE